MNDWSPLMSACLDGSLQKVQSQLAEGANVNTADKDGWTPLMIASAKGNLEIIRLLLGRNADVHAVAKNGMTAMKVAQSQGKAQVVALLQEKFAGQPPKAPLLERWNERRK